MPRGRPRKEATAPAVITESTAEVFQVVSTKSQPTAYVLYDDKGTPIREVYIHGGAGISDGTNPAPSFYATIVTKAELDALRSHCAVFKRHEKAGFLKAIPTAPILAQKASFKGTGRIVKERELEDAATDKWMATDKTSQQITKEQIPDGIKNFDDSDDE